MSSFTPRVTKSSIVQPSSDLSSSTASLSTPAPRSPHPTTPSPQPQASSSSSFPFPSTPISPSASSSPLLTSAARRRDPSTSTSTYSAPSSSQKPRQRTPSITSRRSSISSAGTSSTNYGGFHPVSHASSKPLPPLLHSNSSTQGEEGIEDYFNVGKGKGKEIESIGLGKPPPSSFQTLESSSKSTRGSTEKEGAQEMKKRSFSLPSFLKRSPSSSSNKVPPSETGKGEKDVEERLRSSMAASGASGSTKGKGKGK